jgi:hypothetical protein
MIAVHKLATIETGKDDYARIESEYLTELSHVVVRSAQKNGCAASRRPSLPASQDEETVCTIPVFCAAAVNGSRSTTSAIREKSWHIYDNWGNRGYAQQRTILPFTQSRTVISESVPIRLGMTNHQNQCGCTSCAGSRSIDRRVATMRKGTLGGDEFGSRATIPIINISY